tara:strand:+ start:25039 stop:25398 length:360 start_codon:yes stop_codon:yes gene_type:complete
MKALVHIEAGLVVQFVEDADTFEAHSDYAWKDIDETALSFVKDTDQPPDFDYDKETDTISRTVLQDEPYFMKRKFEYNEIPEQLDQLWHDIDDGKLGDVAKTGTWYLGVKSTKAAFPKD